MMAADIRPENRPMPVRTRAIVRARYLRRARRGTVLQLTERLPVFEMGEVIAELVRRRLELGLSTEAIEHAAGLVDNHVAKLEAGGRVPGLDLILLILKTMGGRLEIRWDPPPAKD